MTEITMNEIYGSHCNELGRLGCIEARLRAR